MGFGDEGIDKGLRDAAKNRADHRFNRAIGKFVIQLEFDLAGVVHQRGEAPCAFERAKRAFDKLHFQSERLANIARAKVRFDFQKFDVQRDIEDGFAAFVHGHAAAPGQKARVILNAIDQFEHAICAVGDKNRFANGVHGRTRVKWPALRP